jgi:hypothetical protein
MSAFSTNATSSAWPSHTRTRRNPDKNPKLPMPEICLKSKLGASPFRGSPCQPLHFGHADGHAPPTGPGTILYDCGS